MHTFDGLQADCAICLPSESFCQSRYGFAKQLGPRLTFAKPALSMSHVRFCNYITEPCYIRSHRIHTRRWYARQGSTRKGCPVPTHTAVPLFSGKGSTLCARVEQCEIGNCVSRVMEIHKHILDIWVFRPCSQPAPPPTGFRPLMPSCSGWPETSTKLCPRSLRRLVRFYSHFNILYCSL